MRTSSSPPPPPPPSQDEERLSAARARARLAFPRLDDARLAAEVAYAAAPLAHLAAVGAFGQESWRPFMVSLGCDLFRLATSLVISLFGEGDGVQWNPDKWLSYDPLLRA